MAYALQKTEQKAISDIEKAYYMPPILAGIDRFVNAGNNAQNAWQSAFDQIHEILNGAKEDVEAILKKRQANGEIRDIRQAMKSIAGNGFSNAIVYLFLQNKVAGNIKPDVFITSKKSQVPGFAKMFTVHIGEETQKPDCDLVIYTAAGKAGKYMILSLKTSLRERAGQTYKWKLLLDIATSENSIKEKYNISYPSGKMPLVGFATVNFYNEINAPQHRGMFKFFDQSFIAKPSGTDLVVPLSHLVGFVNEKL